jgi:hypothetical protein
VREIAAASDLLHELTELTGEDQSSYKVARVYREAQGDIPRARAMLGLPPLGMC